VQTYSKNSTVAVQLLDVIGETFLGYPD